MKPAKLDDEVDQLFQLPLSEFTGARNTLAARLKQTGRAGDANLVKTLAKPPVSAWTVNQLYWSHREAFDTLLAAGQRFHKAQTAGKVADMRGALEARRAALTNLADLAETLLVEAGHNPSGDTVRRITTTLEALSAYASVADGPTLGRLSEDVDPPGFESLAGFIPGPAPKRETAPASQKSSAPAAAKQKSAREDREAEQTRQVRIAAAKLSLQSAKRLLADARVRAQSMESAQKKAYAEAKQAEKQTREAEERFKKAKLASDAAAERLQSIADDADEATKAVEDAKLALDKATKELEASFREQPS
ncbi:MAG TPA: hypothetical protein VFS77_06975 [Pyrinomonadaceae bacterium]|nr:hypothetical protein [Pyrinomonadaceae bacterium]